MEKKDLDKGNQLSDSRFASEARPILFETVERRALRCVTRLRDDLVKPKIGRTRKKEERIAKVFLLWKTTLHKITNIR